MDEIRQVHVAYSALHFFHSVENSYSLSLLSPMPEACFTAVVLQLYCELGRQSLISKICICHLYLQPAPVQAGRPTKFVV